MANNIEKIAEARAADEISSLTVTVGDQRVNISEAGIWVDLLDDQGNVQSSFAKAWEELTEEEADLYTDLYTSNVYQLVTRDSVPWLDADLPALVG